MGQIITRIKMIRDEKKERELYKNVEKKRKETSRDYQYAIDKKLEYDLINNFN